MTFKAIKKTDPEIASVIAGELHRQKYGLELIASENIVSSAVMAAQGSVLTNKYAEGYPDKRYYGDANMWMWRKSWPWTGQWTCSAPRMPTSSPIPALRPTWRYTSPCFNRVTPFWG